MGCTCQGGPGATLSSGGQYSGHADFFNAWQQDELASLPDPVRLAVDADIVIPVPEAGRDFVLGDTFPHEALYDQLNGLSLTKGCYVGQEIIIRILHRGGGRVAKRLVTLAFDERPQIMGIVNVTPDSFSDGGQFSDPAAAIQHGLLHFFHKQALVAAHGVERFILYTIRLCADDHLLYFQAGLVLFKEGGDAVGHALARIALRSGNSGDLQEGAELSHGYSPWSATRVSGTPTMSASRCMGTLEPWASSTKRMI